MIMSDKNEHFQFELALNELNWPEYFYLQLALCIK